jgi:hypothetical protein
MQVLPVFFIVFFILAIVVGPLIGEDDRPGIKRPDVKARQSVGAWFFKR